MRYRIYAHLGPVPNFEGQDVLVEESTYELEDDLTWRCSKIMEFGFLLGGQVGRKIWIDPAFIQQLWCDPVAKKEVVN